MQKVYVFDDPSAYVFDNDFVQISGGKAQLKIGESEDTYSQTFSSSTGFTYDSALAEFTGGLLRQKDQRPSGALFGASYASSIDASWTSTGSLSGTAINGALVSAGKLVLSGGVNRSVQYDSTGRIGIQAGAIRFKWTPNYNGTPTDTQLFFTLSESEGSNNSIIQLMHHPNGSLFLFACDKDGNNIYSNSILVFDAVAGTENIIELGWDLSGGGKFYLFGNGFLVASLDGTFLRTDCAFLSIGGSDVSGTNQGSFDDVITFDSNQHTATHTPTYSVPDSAYVASQAILPEMEYNAGDGTFLEAIALTTTESNTPKYSIQIGRSGNYLYWTGSAWATSNGTFAQATDKATFLTHISTLPMDGEIYVQLKVHFSTSNLQQSIDSLFLDINESTIYSTVAQKITPQGRFQAKTLISFSNSVVTPANTFVRYILEVDSHKLYWSGSSFRRSDGSYEQSNTKQELEDHIVQAISASVFESAYVKLIIFLKTDNSSATPQLTSATLDYSENIGGLRGYLNYILEFIGTESLTDEEFDSITIDDIDDQLAVYNTLLVILQDREVVSDVTAQLQYYFLAKGVNVLDPNNARSNIFVGSEL